MASRLRALLPWLIFFVVLHVHYRSPIEISFDSGYSIHLAMSLLQEGDFDLDEYRDVIPPDDYRVMEIDGHLRSRYPEGPSIVAAPFVAAIKSLTKHVLHIRLDDHIRRGSPAGLEKLIASVLVAITAVLIFRLARRRLDVGLALVVVFIFAFCTSAWSVVSRGLWQHGPSMLFLAAALDALLGARDRPRRALWAGLFLAGAYVMRPTNALPVALLTIYVVAAHRAWIGRFFAGATAVALPFLALNLARFGSLLPWYYRQGTGKFQLFEPDFLEAAAGQLISPGRGLFLYSSVFLFSLLGIGIKFRRGRWTRLDTALVAILVLHWIVISSWLRWWGGTVFGPRLFADLIPFLIYFLIPAVEQLRAPGLRRWALAAGLAATVAVSFSIHHAGASYKATWDWNVDPVHINQDPGRLWDWHDPPFLRR